MEWNSDKMMKFLQEEHGLEVEHWDDGDENRTDELAIEVKINDGNSCENLYIRGYQVLNGEQVEDIRDDDETSWEVNVIECNDGECSEDGLTYEDPNLVKMYFRLRGILQTLAVKVVPNVRVLIAD